MRKNNKGVTLIALIVTIIVLIIIAGISIATLTGDNGVLKQTSTSKAEQLKATAREQVELACSAIKLAIEEAVIKDNNYSALQNSSKIQSVLLNALNTDKTGLNGEFKEGTNAESSIEIVYDGEDYKNATNNPEAKITYTIALGKNSIEIADVKTGTEVEEEDSKEEINQYGFYYNTPYTATLGEEKISLILKEGGAVELFQNGVFYDLVPEGTVIYDVGTITFATCVIELSEDGLSFTSNVLDLIGLSLGELNYVCTFEEYSDIKYDTWYYGVNGGNKKVKFNEDGSLIQSDGTIIASEGSFTYNLHKLISNSESINYSISMDGTKIYNIENDIILIGTTTQMEQSPDDSGSTEIPTQTYDLASKASIGDYVNYNPTVGGNATAENTVYTSPKGSASSHGNGYGDQIFSAEVYNNSGRKWRILDIDNNGKITLISDLILASNILENGLGLTHMNQKGLMINDGVGYIWAEEELHRIASIYGHGKGADTNQTVTYYYGGPNDQDLTATGEFKLTGVEAQQGRKATLSLNSGARALTVEDINKICGVDTTYTVNYSSSTVTKNSDNATYYPTINGISSTGQSEAQSTFSGDYYYTFYNYLIESTNSDTDAQTKQNSMLKLGKYYWLASRSMAPSSYNVFFNVRNVNSDGNVDSIDTCNCNHDGLSACSSYFGVRAIVNLKPRIQTGDTEYDSNTGWNLVE